MENNIQKEFDSLLKNVRTKIICISMPILYLKELDEFLEKINGSRSNFLWKACIAEVRRKKKCSHPQRKEIMGCPLIDCSKCRYRRKGDENNEAG